MHLRASAVVATDEDLLIKKYTEMMLGRWDSGKGLGQQYHAPLKDFLLRQVAYEMHRRQVTSLTADEFQSLITAQLMARGYEADASVLLDEIVTRSGLFRVLGGSVEFRHLLLQEFFAGRGIPSSGLLEEYVSEDWWQRAIVFYFGENPGDSKGLEAARASVISRTPAERYRAAISLGLALQACYLVEVREKIEIFSWVVEVLSSLKDEFIAASIADGSPPLMAFLWYYILGRDSVACGLPVSHRPGLLDRLVETAGNRSEAETREFWMIVSLLECGLVREAEQLSRQFKPDDDRLTLGIFLGALLIEHLRVMTKDQKAAAARIVSRLHERVAPMRSHFIEQFTSELFEVRQGQLKALPEADPS